MEEKNEKKLITLGLVCTLVLSMSTACGNKKRGEKGNSSKNRKNRRYILDKISKKGTLKIGLCPEYPPFESVNDAGEIEGFDADLATAIAEDMGIKVEFANTPWEGLISRSQ
ncbi:MAG: transporter substrate-binding domain-containing protein [Muricomes sp.]